MTNREKIENDTYDVLMIEDDDRTVVAITEFFRLKGYICKGFLSGSKGLEELKKCTPKLIILDINLPDINGYDICKKIKSDEKIKEIPVFFISALPVLENLERINETGAEGLICKPFNFSSLEPLFKYL